MMPTLTNPSERNGADQGVDAMRITADQPVDNYPTKRLKELQEEIPLLDKAMADARHRIERFVENHPQQRTTFTNGVLVGRIGAMELRHPDLRAAESELDNLVLRWHATLGEYAALKQKMRQW